MVPYLFFSVTPNFPKNKFYIHLWHHKNKILIEHQKIPLLLPQILFVSTAIPIEPQNIYFQETLNWSLCPLCLNCMQKLQNSKIFSLLYSKKNKTKKLQNKLRTNKTQKTLLFQTVENFAGCCSWLICPNALKLDSWRFSIKLTIINNVEKMMRQFN